MSTCATCKNRIWWVARQKAECKKGHQIDGQFYATAEICSDHELGIQEIRS